MKVEMTAQGQGAQPRPQTAADTLAHDRQAAESGVPSATENDKVPSEEILTKVKALFDGNYSIRFERDQLTQKVVMRLVDNKTGETIRQLPPEELLQMAQFLKHTKGQLLNTTS